MRRRLRIAGFPSLRRGALDPPCAGQQRLPGGNKVESADKPGSVVGNHSSGPHVAMRLKQPTRGRRGPRHGPPIRSCSRWGLPCRSVARLAVRSCRTVSPLPRMALASPPAPPFGGLLSVALSVGSRRPGVTWHLALWSPDFPRCPCGHRGCLADSAGESSSTSPSLRERSAGSAHGPSTHAAARTGAGSGRRQ